MKKLLIGLMIWTAIAILLSSFSEQAFASTQTPNPIQLNLATVPPPVGSTGEELNWYADEIAERTNGAVKIKIAWASTLAGPKDMPDAVRTGSIDIAHLPWVAFHPSLVPLHTITMKCSAFRANRPLALWMAALKLYDEFPEFDEEYKSNNMIRVGYRGTGGINIETKKPIKVIEDFKGLKIVVHGLVDQTLIKAAGGVPVAMMPNQVADNMLKGVIDGAGNATTSSVRFKTFEAAKYYIRFAEPVLGQDTGFAITMNLDTWNKLSPDIQKIFLEVRDEYPLKFAEFDIKDTEKAYKTIEEAGLEIINFPASETERWKALIDTKQMNEDWIVWATKNTKVPEQKLRQILTRYQELINEMQGKYPQSW